MSGLELGLFRAAQENLATATAMLAAAKREEEAAYQLFVKARHLAAISVSCASCQAEAGQPCDWGPDFDYRPNHTHGVRQYAVGVEEQTPETT